MTGQLHPLSDADLAAIATSILSEVEGASAAATPAQLARSLGSPYFTVAKAVQRIRRNGWTCRLVARPCIVFGLTLLSPSGSRRRLMHPGCTPARAAERQRGYRRGPHTPSTRSVQRWRTEHPDELAAEREREKARQRERWPERPEEERASMLDRLHRSDWRDAALTRDDAEHSGEPWDAEEDAYVLAHLREPARDVALTLGRTLWAVRNRRARLRRLG